jgi:hypothetical protein
LTNDDVILRPAKRFSGFFGCDEFGGGIAIMEHGSGGFRTGSSIMSSIRVVYRRLGPEPFIWMIALVYLAIHDPYVQSEFTICPFRNLGFHYCPGCGLGRAVSFLLHGDIVRSVQTHLLGIPATIILGFRIFSLLNNALKRPILQPSVH